MSEIRRSGPLSSTEAALRAEEILDRFENCLRKGERAPIEEFLAGVPKSEHGPLLRELLATELEYRCRAGESPRLEEYLLRFEGQDLLVRDVYRQVMSRGSDPSTRTPVPGEWPAVSTVEAKPVDNPPTDWPAVPGYEILEELPSGGMGVVYRARQVRLNRTVALKMIRSGDRARPEELARFRIEAEAAARLDHPNIVRIHDFGEWNGRPYFSMEFVPGGSLREKLLGTRLPPPQAARLIETLARAMYYVHDEKIIHRDLKPANVLLTAEGTLKIADFGLAKRLDQELGPTQSGAAMGTACYMAPEQARGDSKAVGPAADIYALGAILYEMLTGRPPFQEATRELVLFKVLFEEPAQPSRLRDDIPDQIETICLKCLEKDPGRRYASGEELAEDLRRFREGEPLPAPLAGDLLPRWAERAGYEILDIAGCSVVGIIYKARQINLNRLVTLKTISARAQGDPVKMARFRAQAEAAAQLQHPNIVQIYDFGEESGQPYFSMEFVDGGTLAEKCVQAPLPVYQAVDLIETLARATHHAHQHGIIHTDLRPFNVLLTAAGAPKITGFGLARLLEKAPSARGIHGAPLGLSNYMAPEQVGGRAEDISPATDVHALGAILYELLTGRPPLVADTVQETLEQIRTRLPPPPSSLRPHLPPTLDGICLKCLQKKPTWRYASAAALAESLRPFRNIPFSGDLVAATGTYELIPGYELLEELGRGGMGVVYKARQVSLDRLVALKIFREQTRRFLATNRAVARLHHPNLVEVYDCGEREGLLYVAEELVDGGSLRQKSAAGPQSPHQAVRTVHTLALAMHYLHQQGIVHRNLKPSVVLLTPLGIPKIGSFDLAKFSELESDPAEAEGEVIGTPRYMAPEQADGRVREITAAADVYALGAILYELLTGRPPLLAAEAVELIHRVRYEDPPPPSHWQPALPAELDAICLHCLQKNPGRRPASAAALAEDLEGFLAGRFRLPGGGKGLIDWARRILSGWTRRGDKSD